MAVRMAWRIGLAVLAAVCGSQAALAQTAGDGAATMPAKLPFTISPQTTGIIAPLNADGTPDYIGAVNARYGAGVSPEKNGFVAFLDVVGCRTGDRVFAEKTRARMLALAGAHETPADQPVWKYYGTYLGDFHLDAATEAALDDQMLNLRLALWQPSDDPIAAGYITAMGPLLTKADIAAQKPRWWSPLVSGDGRSLENTMLPSRGMIKDVAYVLCARATLRAGRGDFTGFLQDVSAVERLGRHLSGGPTAIEQLVGYAIEFMADQTVVVVAESGKLTADQCRQVERMLDQLPAQADVAEAVDHLERWTMLDTAIQVATGHGQEVLGDPHDPDSAAAALETIDWKALDWDVVLREINAHFDQQVAAMRNADIAAGIKSAYAEVDQWNISTGNLAEHSKETREQYSIRVAKKMMSVISPSFGALLEIAQRPVIAEQATHVILSAAQWKARTGQWPQTMQQMVPQVMRELPRDMYAANKTDPLVYMVTPLGPRVYSVGPNGKDEGGVRGNGADDISQGGTEPPELVEVKIRAVGGGAPGPMP